MISSRPAQAMRGGAVVLVLAVAFRVPAIERRFAEAIAAANRPVMPGGAVHLANTATAPSRAALATRSDSPPIRRPVPAAPRVHRRGTMLAATALARSPPAQAGTGTLPSPPLPAVAAATSPAPPSSTAFDLATSAYARLAEGDRRGAVRLFDAALSFDDPRGATWRRARDALTRRWSANAYSIVRAGGTPGNVVSPVLGGGQSGGGVAFTPDPLAARPLALTLRGAIAHDDRGRTAFAAVGVQWRLLPGMTVAAERLTGLGAAAPGQWTARVAAGGDRRFGRWRATAYAEAGIVGSSGYAAGQGRVGPEVRVGAVTLTPGAGGWGSVQRTRGQIVDRLDVGPGVAAHSGPLTAQLDYRFRVAGNAAPGSGPVLTLSAGF
jgi:hypothetical protein